MKIILMSLKKRVKELKRERKKIKYKNKVKNEDISDFIWEQKGELFSLKDWQKRKIENSGFSNGLELEEIVSKLCQRLTVIDLVFISPKYIDKKGIEKEICDLIILHKNTIFSFQIKHKTLSEKKEKDVIFERAKSTYKHSISQFDTLVSIFKDKNEIKLKNKRGNEINIQLNEFNNRELISLICFPGKDKFPEEKQFELINSFEEFREHPVHIFDIDDFDKITREFDTTCDFLYFLEIRKIFFMHNKLGDLKDLDLVASIKLHYEEIWGNIDSINNKIILGVHLWEEYSTKYITAIKRRLNLNIDSYLFDLIIEMSHRSIGYIQEFSNTLISTSIDEHFKMALEFSQFKRLYRRGISEAIISCLFRSSKNNFEGKLPYAHRLCWYDQRDDAIIILSVVDSKFDRKKRKEFLLTLCRTAAYKFSLKTVVGIATESSETTNRSEDFIILSDQSFNEDLVGQSFKNIANMHWGGTLRPSTSYEFQK